MTHDVFSTLVRPVVTLGFSAAQIGIAYLWTTGVDGAEQAFAALTPFTMMIVTFWFKDREAK